VSAAIIALTRLHECGRQILIDLFGPKVRDKLPEAIRWCQDACIGWDKPGWDPNAPRPPFIVVRTSVGDGIPIDMLPLLNFDRANSDDDYGTVAKLARSFLGFSAIVKRDIGVAPPASFVLENMPRLPIKLFIHRGLEGARREEMYFRQNNYIDIEPSWFGLDAPSDPQTFLQALASYLWEPAKGIRGNKRDPADQICHFACHCNAGDILAINYELLLQSGRIRGQQKFFWDYLEANCCALRCARSMIDA
jgi:hypothetical protein